MLLRTRNKIIAGCCALTVAVGAYSFYEASNSHARAAEMENRRSIFQVEATALPLRPDSPADNTVGELTYVAGWQLTSLNPDFGGWSGLVVKNGGKNLVAISDWGVVMEASVSLTDSTPLSSVHMSPYPGRKVEQPKGNFDAESMIAVEGGYLISFEDIHRVEFMPDDYLDGTPEDVPTGVDYSVLAANNGLEAMVKLADGTLVLFAENGRDSRGTLAMWTSKNGVAKAHRFKAPRNFSPTDAAVLPCGDVLVLMRRYSALEGVSAKLMHVEAEALLTGGLISGREIAHIEAPLPVDNMEALDIVQLENGDIRLFMLSDDNFNPLQDTILLIFDWELPKPCAQKAL